MCVCVRVYVYGCDVSVPGPGAPHCPLPQILLLDLSSGAVLWSHLLPSSSRDPHSASLMTADHRSVFFFWGLHQPVGTNETVLVARLRVQPEDTGPRLPAC